MLNTNLVPKIALFTLFTSPGILGLSHSQIAEAAIIVSDVGDQDGFNGVYDPFTTPLPFQFTASDIPPSSISDPAFTDQDWMTIPDRVPTYSHQFSIPSGAIISNVQFETAIFDMAGETFPVPGFSHKLLIDGIEIKDANGNNFFNDAVGDTFNGSSSGSDGAAELFVMDLPSAIFADILDGDVDVQIIAVGTGRDGIAVDYSRLTIEYEQVPEPLNILSSVLAVGFGFLYLRRSNKSNV